MAEQEHPALSADVTIKVQFFDLDPMNVVWHGHYARYLEVARCALLDRIGYNYAQMAASGYAWPIVDLRIKYVAPLRFGQQARVSARVVAFENGLKIDYLIRDAISGALLTRAHTFQVPVRLDTGELCLESPPELTGRVRSAA
jgi:acyl-CoA thioester hydrolase